jgi:hypothetical protein
MERSINENKNKNKVINKNNEILSLLSSLCLVSVSV